MISIFQTMNEESVKFVETVNLFNVSFGKGLEGLNQYYEKAIEFQNRLEEKLGVNIEESMNYQALFNSMSKSMGITADYSYLLSENFTKLGYDLASLYNIDPENAMQKLRAGLAGQTKPLRDLGLDITQQSLQPIVDSLGIERSLQNMSQAEKMILRYIAVLEQAQIAHGDFANTMESPANQLRIFNAQVIAFRRNMGNLWQGFLGGILPYINAIMMVINELLKMVAKLFGFEVSEQSVNISASVGADELADDLGSATGKAKELKNQLMGFDEINNITLDKNSGGGSGGGVSVSGIDQRLLDAMKEYDNLMDKVKNKATEIRDKIMEWLGFTKKINPLTGEISWEFTGLSKQAKIILNIIKAIVAIYLTTKLIKFVGWLNTLVQVVKGLKVPVTSFQNGLLTTKNALATTGTYLQLGVEQFKIYRDAGNGIATSLGKTGSAMISLIPNIVKVGGGIAGLAGSSALAYKSMEDLSNGTISTNEAMLKLTGSIAGAIASGALIGSVFGPAGIAIGALTGLLIGATTAVVGYKDETDKLCESIDERSKETKEYLDTINAEKEAIQDMLNLQLAEVEYTETLTNELKNLVDANGKVKAGYEDRVKFILNQINEAYGTEYELINNTINKYGELQDEIYNLINLKKAELALNANQEAVYQAISRQTEMQHRKIEAEKELMSITTEYNNKLSEIEEKYGSLDEARKMMASPGAGGWFAVIEMEQLGELEEKLNQSKETYNSLQQSISADNQLIIQWEDLKTATITGDADKIDEALKGITNTYQTETGTQTATLAEQLSKEIDFTNERRKIWLENGIEINEERKIQLEAGMRDLVNNLVAQTKSVETLSEDQKEAWKILSKGNLDIYTEYLGLMNPTLSQELQEMTGVIIEKTPAVEEVTQELSDTIVSSLDNSAETREKAVDAVEEYMLGLSENEQRQLLKQAGIENAEEVIKGLKEGNLAEDVGVNILKGLNTGLKNNYWQGQALSTAFSFATNVLNKFKNRFGIQSPSKETKQFGAYLLEGLGIGIEKNSDGIFKKITDFSSKVLNKFKKPLDDISKETQISTKDFAIDTNQFIDYGEITGAIATQSNLNINGNIAQQIYNAVVKGMQNVTIPIEIEARTDEGVVFKKIQIKANEFAQQTGENPFPVMV